MKIILLTVYGNPLPAAASPAGDATAANQATQITIEQALNVIAAAISAQLPASLGAKTTANSLAVTLPTDASGLPITIEDGADVTLGSKTDAAAISPLNASQSQMSLEKGFFNVLVALNNNLTQLYSLTQVGGGVGKGSDPASPDNGQNSGTSGKNAGLVALFKRYLQAYAINLDAPLSTIVTPLGSILTTLQAALPLPTGASTAAKQDTGNTSLASIVADTDNLNSYTFTDLVTGVSNGATKTLPKACRSFMVQTIASTTTAATFTASIQTSLNGIDWSSQIGTFTNAVNFLKQVDVPALFIRINVTVNPGGNVAVNILAMP